MISAAPAVLIGRSPKGDTSQRFQTLWPRGRQSLAQQRVAGIRRRGGPALGCQAL